MSLHVCIVDTSCSVCANAVSGRTGAVLPCLLLHADLHISVSLPLDALLWISKNYSAVLNVVSVSNTCCRVTVFIWE